ncbi:MAG TPA: hypothetical protein VNN73_09960 [Blastocatellia bacterium]|nr:hypothetical protein [Blastocatellia bacterium]
MQVTYRQNDVEAPPRALAEQLEWLFVKPVTKLFDARTMLWLALAIVFSVYLASLALQQAFSSQFVLQDDARQHIFYTASFADADLFTHDLIADYFRSVAPAGYTSLYKIAATLGIDPFYFSKLLPMALGLITTIFCFAVSMRLLAIPSAAFVSTLLLNESLWMRNGLVSATPRAFISPLFLAFMFYLLRESVIGTVITVALMGLFFPSILIVAIGVLALRLIKLERRRPKFSRERRDWLIFAAAVTVAALVMIPYAIQSSRFGPVVSASEARSMPEFLPKGRMVVFRQGFIEYWFTGSHTGMFSSAVFSPFLMYIGLLLPVLMLFPKQLPLIRSISGKITLLPQIVLSSLVTFIAANLLLFHLYLPSRFTVNSFRILLALSSAISIIILLDAFLRWARKGSPSLVRPLIAAASAALLFAALVLPQAVTGSWIDTRYKKGEHPELYEFLSRQPKDALVASLSNEADNLPVFARRSILVGKETAIPFHKGYYSQIRQRAIDLIHAQYSPHLSELQSFIQKYGIAFLLVDDDTFTPEYITGDKWIMLFQPAAKEAAAKLKEGVVPALQKLVEKCAALKANGLTLVSAECILNAKQSDDGNITVQSPSQ